MSRTSLALMEREQMERMREQNPEQYDAVMQYRLNAEQPSVQSEQPAGLRHHQAETSRMSAEAQAELAATEAALIAQFRERQQPAAPISSRVVRPVRDHAGNPTAGNRSGAGCCSRAVGCIRIVPMGGVLGGALVVVGGAISVGAANDLENHLDINGAEAFGFVRFAFALIFLTSIPIVWRGVIGGLREYGCHKAGFRPRCCSSSPDRMSGAWTVALLWLLLWPCAIFAVAYLCIAEALYIIIACLTATCGFDSDTQDVVIQVGLVVLQRLNEAPINARLNLTASAETDALFSSACDDSSILTRASERLLGGAAVLLLAVILLVVHWTKYSKAWDFAPAYGRAQLVDAPEEPGEIELPSAAERAL